jgi:hypothetical protein
MNCFHRSSDPESMGLHETSVNGVACSFTGGSADDEFIPHDLDLEQRSVLEAEVLIWRLRCAAGSSNTRVLGAPLE